MFQQLTGWMVATTFRVPMTQDLLGIDVPPIVTTVDRSVRQWIEQSHMIIAYVLAALVLVHIVAARSQIFRSPGSQAKCRSSWTQNWSTIWKPSAALA
jgi:cytochrome b561